MNITKHLQSVFTYPQHQGHPNVIRRVRWILRFERDGLTSEAGVETFLNVDAIENFIPANEIGTERILQWAYDAQGGDAFVSQLLAVHEEQLNYKAACAGQEIYSEGFDFGVPDSRTQGEMPSTVL